MDEKVRKRQWRFTIVYVIWVILMILMLRGAFTPRATTKPVSYSDFLVAVRAGRLQSVHITERQVIGKLKAAAPQQNKAGAPEQNKTSAPQQNKAAGPQQNKAGAPQQDKTSAPQQDKTSAPPQNSTQPRQSGRLAFGKSTPAPPPQQIVATRIPGLDAGPLIQELEKQGVKFSGEIPAPSWWSDALIMWGPMILIFLIYGFAMWKMRRGGGGALSFGKNRAKIHDQSSTFDTKFTDVAGLEEAKAELWEIVDFLKNPQKYQRLGGRIPKGVLLVGAPGTGKTLLARATAGEARVPFFFISGSEFVEMFVGVGAARVRDLFEQAKQRAPCIIFIDELDAIGKSRGAGQVIVTNDEREQTLNQLLVEMDGFDSSKGVTIMAATNTPEVLDPALMRPGRFDRQVVLDRPDIKEREAILRVHARKLKVAPNVDYAAIAAETPGMVGADLANIVNEAALGAARRNADQIEMRDFESAVDRVTLGFEKKGRLISRDEKRRVAYHEAGHALVALSVPHADPVRRISIIPRSIGSLGHTLQLPEQDKYLLTVPELEDRISVMLGGRGAEDLVYSGVVSTGASDDLAKASDIARQMVTRFGMSEHLGNMTYGLPRESRFLRTAFGSEERNYSERTAEEIDADVRRLMDRLYERVKEILDRRHSDLDRVVAELIKKETLDREEFENLLGVKQHEPEPQEEPVHSAK